MCQIQLATKTQKRAWHAPSALGRVHLIALVAAVVESTGIMLLWFKWNLNPAATSSGIDEVLNQRERYQSANIDSFMKSLID